MKYKKILGCSVAYLLVMLYGRYHWSIGILSCAVSGGEYSCLAKTMAFTYDVPQFWFLYFLYRTYSSPRWTDLNPCSICFSLFVYIGLLSTVAIYISNTQSNWSVVIPLLL